MKKIILTILLAMVLTGSCSARTEIEVPAEEGFDPYFGFIVADMTMEDGVVSDTAAYSMRVFKDFGLVPVAYCNSGGSTLGDYYTFYVNPYHDCLIIGRQGTAVHGSVFGVADLQPFDLTGQFIYYTDKCSHQDLYRKVIKAGKEEFFKYQEMMKRFK